MVVHVAVTEVVAADAEAQGVVHSRKEEEWVHPALVAVAVEEEVGEERRQLFGSSWYFSNSASRSCQSWISVTGTSLDLTAYSRYLNESRIHDHHLSPN
jgi:hypothetical protein